MNGYSLLADLVVVLHLLWVAYVVLGFAAILIGAVLRWKWTRRRLFRWSHAVMTAIVAVEGMMGWVCPLTTWERDLRVAGGETPEEASFVGRLARDLLFVEIPQDQLNKVYVVFGLIVLLVLWRFPPGRAAGRNRAGKGA